MNLIAVFLTGLTTGGLSCLALQGGLLASVIANQKKQGNTYSLLSVFMFLISKLAVHTLFGFFLGILGAKISFGLGLRLSFQFFTALFMLATAMNLLEVHPIFRYLSFQPPRFLQRLVRNHSHSQTLFAPAVLGALTIFIPCGVTQAMEILAINSAKPFSGALIMLVFVLGTIPLFSLLGLATATFGQKWSRTFTRLAAAVLIIMAVYSLNAVLVAANSPLTFQKLIQKQQPVGETAVIEDNKQKVTIEIFNSGYRPRYIRVKKNLPVELTLKSDKVYSCALSFLFPAFDINTFLKETDTKVFLFTPERVGKYTFSCSMGMYSGVMEVF